MPDKSFIATSNGHRFKFIQDEIGYSVSEIGVRGVNTQGDTFEEALANAHEASALMAEFREEMRAESVAKTRKKRARQSVTAKA